jgi:hypothetical protein
MSNEARRDRRNYLRKAIREAERQRAEHRERHPADHMGDHDFSWSIGQMARELAGIGGGHWTRKDFLTRTD